jgi:hypothetical protein
VNRSAERRFLRAEVRTNDQLYDIARVGNLAMDMAFLHLLSGDEDAAALARECIETLMRFPRWDYFLEGGKDVIGLQRAPNSALAVSLVLECLGENVPQEDRERWLTALAERGIEPSYRSTFGMRYPDRVKGWSFDTTSTYLVHRPADKGLNLSRWPIILNTINLKAIPASALALSALTYRKYRGDSEATRRWLEQAVYSIGTFRHIFCRDGSYSEGVSYANYTALHLMQAIDALHRTGVADLRDLLNWPGYQTYLLEMSLSTRNDPSAIVNFSDAGSGALASGSFWIARHTRDGLAQWFGENLSVRRDPWSVLWYDRSIPAAAPSPGPRLWKSELDWIVGRSGYGPEDLVVAMRSGPPQNHEHADRNSLIVKCYGEKLVVDPMRPPYNFADPAWRMRLTEGHSAVLIDGKGHQYVDGREGTNASKAEATIVRWGERDGHTFWTSDATPAYALTVPDVRSVIRTVIILYRIPAVVVLDKIIKQNEPSLVQARFYADNTDGKGTVAADGSSFTVVRPHAMLGGRSIGSAGTTFRAGRPPIPEQQAVLHPFADVSSATPARDILLITVLLPLKNSSELATVQLTSKGNVYSAHIGDDLRAVNLRVIDDGTIPAFEVR